MVKAMQLGKSHCILGQRCPTFSDHDPQKCPFWEDSTCNCPKSPWSPQANMRLLQTSQRSVQFSSSLSHALKKNALLKASSHLKMVNLIAVSILKVTQRRIKSFVLFIIKKYEQNTTKMCFCRGQFISSKTWHASLQWAGTSQAGLHGDVA